MIYNHAKGTQIGWADDLKNDLTKFDPLSWRISYSLNFQGDMKYTLENIFDYISRVIWKYECCDEDDYTHICKCSCTHCGNGKKVLYIFKLDKDYGIFLFWNGCLTFDPSGTFTISNSLTDLINMCMTREQRELFQNNYISKCK